MLARELPYRLVGFFDEDMPKPDCWEGCDDDEHLCRKGFPDRVKIISRRKEVMGKRDYHVVRKAMDFFAEVERYNTRTYFVIFTGDTRFWTSAFHQLQSKNGRGERDVKFTSKNRILVKLDHGTKNERRLRIRIETIRRPKGKKGVSAKPPMMSSAIRRTVDLLDERWPRRKDYGA